MRLASGAEVAQLQGHILRNFRKYARAESATGDSVWNWLAFGDPSQPADALAGLDLFCILACISPRRIYRNTRMTLSYGA